jgi:hypothetical protein
MADEAVGTMTLVVAVVGEFAVFVTGETPQPAASIAAATKLNLVVGVIFISNLAQY